MITLKEYQEKAVGRLVDYARDLLNENGDRRKLVFKAPTGAGKTVMAYEMLDRLTKELDGQNREIAYVWIAPNKLHEQSYLSMKDFIKERRSLRPMVFDDLDHSSESYIQAGDMLFVNWQSVNKDNNIMVRESEQMASLFDMTHRTSQRGIPIVCIIDEEHMFAGRNAEKSEAVLRRIYPKMELRISATPQTIGDAIVRVPIDEVKKEEMIKQGIVINPQIDSPEEGVSADEYLIDCAIEKLNEIKTAYAREGTRINPLLLIQLPNDTDNFSDEDRRIKDIVIERLKDKHQITTDNVRLAVWLSTEKANLEGIEDNNCFTDVLLFKQAIAMGWDCPRAAVLLIFREIRSQQFGTQTVGRIMRMPEQKHYHTDLLNHGYVYTNLSKDCIEIVGEEMNYITKPLQAKRREGLDTVRLTSWYSERLGSERNRLGAGFWRVLVDEFNAAWFRKPMREIMENESNQLEISEDEDTL